MNPIQLSEQELLDPGRWRVLGFLGVAQLMLILDVTVVALALPQMGAELELGRGELTWVVSAYALTFGGLLLLGGRSADLFGSRAIVLTGISLFTGASLLTGLATGPAILIGGRVAQGVAAALLSPAALSVIVKTFTGEELNRALGVWSALGGSGAAIGVLLGGLLTAGPGWRWVFFINVPIGLIMVAALAVLLHRDRPAVRNPRLDILGAATVTAGTALAVYGITNAGELGLGNPLSFVPLIGAALSYLLFVFRQRTASVPLMDIGILVRRPVAAGTFLIFVATALMISVFFLGTFYFQQHRQFGPLMTGLLFLPVAGATIAGAQLAGRLVGGRGARTVGATGLTVTALGMALPAVTEGTPALVIGITTAALGLGAVFVVASTTALANTPNHEAGIASGILSTFHEFGAAFGVAATSSLAAASIAGIGTEGFTTGLTSAAIVALVGGAIALGWVPRATIPQ